MEPILRPLLFSLTGWIQRIYVRPHQEMWRAMEMYLKQAQLLGDNVSFWSEGVQITGCEDANDYSDKIITVTYLPNGRQNTLIDRRDQEDIYVKPRHSLQ